MQHSRTLLKSKNLVFSPHIFQRCSSMGGIAAASMIPRRSLISSAKVDPGIEYTAIIEQRRVIQPKAAFEVEIGERPWPLMEMLDRSGLDVTHVQFTPIPLSPTNQVASVHIGEEGDSRELAATIREIESRFHVPVRRLNPLVVPWFPKSLADIDIISRSFYNEGNEIQPGSPGANDPQYINRRKEIGQSAMDHRLGAELPKIVYNEKENETWNAVFMKLSELFKDHACEEFLEVFEELKRRNIYSPRRLPFLQGVSEFLQEKTGFTIYPVAGFLSSRDFLNALAFRIFFSTQYIRHHSIPFYTPEPDIIHELIGHAPMLGNKRFAGFSQLIGLASIGASDEQIKCLASCYWYTIEFGVLKEKGLLKGYGAGVLSSVAELLNATVPEKSISQTQDWDPFDACKRPFPITELQPLYYAAESLDSAFEKMFDYCKTLAKPFSLRYSSTENRIYPVTLVSICQN